MIYMAFGPCCWGLGRGPNESLRLALTDLEMRLIEDDCIVFTIYECEDDEAWIDTEGAIHSRQEDVGEKVTTKIETRAIPKTKIMAYRAACRGLVAQAFVKRENP